MEADGLHSLLATIETLSARKIELSDISILLECVSCIKTLLNSKVGIEWAVDDQKCIPSLLKGNIIKLKQIFFL